MTPSQEVLTRSLPLSLTATAVVSAADYGGRSPRYGLAADRVLIVRWDCRLCRVIHEQVDARQGSPVEVIAGTCRAVSLML
jgi:hypothetical protein